MLTCVCCGEEFEPSPTLKQLFGQLGFDPEMCICPECDELPIEETPEEAAAIALF